MPYVIAFVIIIVAAGALLLFRQPAEAPTTIEPTPQAVTVESEEIPAAEPAAVPVEPAAAVIETDAAAVVDPIPASTAESVATYSSEVSYFTPRRTEHFIDVSLTLNGDTITDATILYDGEAPGTPAHVGFETAYKNEVIGQSIDTVKLSRTGGASLTAVAFNEAVAEIRAQI